MKVSFKKNHSVWYIMYYFNRVFFFIVSLKKCLNCILFISRTQYTISNDNLGKIQNSIIYSMQTFTRINNLTTTKYKFLIDGLCT